MRKIGQLLSVLFFLAIIVSVNAETLQTIIDEDFEDNIVDDATLLENFEVVSGRDGKVLMHNINWDGERKVGKLIYEPNIQNIYRFELEFWGYIKDKSTDRQIQVLINGEGQEREHQIYMRAANSQGCNMLRKGYFDDGVIFKSKIGESFVEEVNVYGWHKYKIVYEDENAQLYYDDNYLGSIYTDEINNITNVKFNGNDCYTRGGEFGFDDIRLVVYTAIPATIDIKPDTLNLMSKGKWIRAYIELPEDYNIGDIDCSSILLEGEIAPESCSRPTEPVVGHHDRDGIPYYMVKFDRSEVAALLSPADEVELTITGELTDGTPFEGSDTIRVIEKRKR